MNRREEDIYYNRLKALRDEVTRKEDIDVESDLYGGIELVLMELLEFAQYSDFKHDREVLYSEEELEDFVRFYTERTYVNVIVPIAECLDILYLLFEFEL